MRLVNGSAVVPSRKLDVVWEEHIVRTIDYLDFRERVCDFDQDELRALSAVEQV